MTDHRLTASFSKLLASAASFLCAGLVTSASALTPGKTITIVVPFAPGGPGDIIGRIMIPGLQEKLKSPVIVETRQGAGGAVGITSVVNAAPDGHTILWTSNAITVDQAIKLKPAYDPLKDLRPMTMVFRAVEAIAMNPQVPASNLRELIAYAKANPGKLNFSHAGVGSFTHMGMELFKVQAGIDIVAVPYRGGGQQALSSTLANDTQLTMLPPAFFLPHLKTGRIKMLVVASTERVPSVPDVPTSGEAGLPGFEAIMWYGAFLPAGTPDDVFSRVEAAHMELLATPDIRQKIEGTGYIPGGIPSAALRRQIENQVKQWRDVVQKAGIPRE